MRLTQRQSKLVKMLVKQNGYKTVKYYAKQLHISERTVHSDLQEVNIYLLHEGYRVDKRPGKGIGLLKVNNPVYKEVKKDDFNIYSTAGRRRKIMQLLLFEGKTVTFEYLSELFLVSKTSIKHDFKCIEEILGVGNALCLVSNIEGTRLDGKEEDFQKAFFEFNRYVLGEDVHIFEEGEEDRKLEILATYYGEEVVRLCANVLYSYIRNNDGRIAEHYVLNVLNMIIILAYRMQNNYHISSSFHESDSKFFKESAQKILINISLHIEVTITPGDINYLTTYLISNRFESQFHDGKYQSIVDKMMLKVSESLRINFTSDTKLKEDLCTHVPAMIYRLQKGIQISNPFISQIKKEFSVIFNVLWVVLSQYEEELHMQFNEDEIGFLTIHFQVAIERTEVHKKILLVCPTGIASSELLYNRIVRTLPVFTTIEVTSIKELSNYELEHFDLLISTIALHIPNIKTIVISPLLNDEDVKNVIDIYNEKFIMSHTKKTSFKELTLNNLANYITSDSIFLNQSYKTKEELLTNVCKQLEEKHWVSEQFVTGVLHREALGGTDLLTGVAIPHGKPKDVLQTKIVIVINNKSIKWTNHFVKVIFLICIAESEIQQVKVIFSDMQAITEDEQNIDTLLQMIYTGEMQACIEEMKE